MKHAFKNCKLLVGSELVDKNVYVEDGKIVQVGGSLSGFESVDCNGHILFPGLVDSHVHFREPGGSHKEDWEHASRAAAKGGVTTVLDMPNTNPACITVRALEEKRELVSGRSLVDYGFHFGATNDNLQEIRRAERIASVKAYIGSTTGNLLVNDDGVLFEVFLVSKMKNVPVTIHADNDAIINEFERQAKRAGESHPRIHSWIRQNVSAATAASKAAIIARAADARIHLTHNSTRQELEIVRLGKQGSSPITTDVALHHLFLVEEDMDRLMNYGKMNPPLRSRADKVALWQGVLDGTVDAIVTDHAPHTREEKEKGYWEAPAGVPGVEYRLPLLLNEVHNQRISLQRVQQLCCEAPAKIYGVENKGYLREGFDADFTLIDFNEEKTITDSDVESKCGWSPYTGMTLRGWPVATYVRGEKVFQEGEFFDPVGREVY